jgi:AbiV family abortive infection protein
MTIDNIPQRRPPYRGSLSSALVAEAMTLAGRNALRLLDDARALVASSRFPSAVALAILAVEEQAKSDILAVLAIWPDEETKERKELWRAFTNHVTKNSLGWMAFLRERPLVEKLIWQRQHEDEPYFDLWKWSGLYVDILDGEAGAFCWTPESITKDQADAFIRIASQIVHPRVVTADEVDLMRAVFHPGRGKTLADQHIEMGVYLQAAVDRGLRPFEPWMQEQHGVRPAGG